jgi:hypothetical protein
MVQLRRQMLERMKYRERMRHQLSSGSGGKPDSPQQRELSSLTQKAIQLEKIESRNKVDIFENAFRKIKEATGVSDVNEVKHGNPLTHPLSLPLCPHNPITAYRTIKALTITPSNISQ